MAGIGSIASNELPVTLLRERMPAHGLMGIGFGESMKR